MFLIDKSSHTMEEYLSVLSSSLQIYIDAERLQKAIREAEWRVQDLASLTLMWLRIESSGSYTLPGPQQLADFLTRRGIDLERKRKGSDTKSVSLDAKKVIAPLIERGVETDLLQHYTEYRTAKTQLSFLRGMEPGLSRAKMTASGRAVTAFDTHVDERDNMRTYYSDLAVVSVPKLYKSIIGAKGDDYYLAWADLPQADLRAAYNLFLRTPENIATMRSYSDAYEGIAVLAEGEHFSHEKFVENRKFYKVSALKVFYNSKDSSPVSGDLRSFYAASERYKQYCYDLRVLYRFGLPIPIKSYFGFEQLLPEASYPDQFISKGLNTPIQTFTSHIVNEIVMGLLKKFWSLGYTKDDINVYFVRHDEPLFQFRKTILKDAWIFKEFSTVIVPGFSPITLNFSFGDFYGEVNQFLTTEIESTYTDPRITETPDGVFDMVVREYSPVGRVEAVGLSVFENDSQGFTVKVFNYRDNSEFTCQAKSTTVEDCLVEVVTNDILPHFGGLDYLLVNNGAPETLFRVGDTIVKSRGRNDKTL